MHVQSKFQKDCDIKKHCNYHKNHGFNVPEHRNCEYNNEDHFKICVKCRRNHQKTINSQNSRKRKILDTNFAEIIKRGKFSEFIVVKMSSQYKPGFYTLIDVKKISKNSTDNSIQNLEIEQLNEEDIRGT